MALAGFFVFFAIEHVAPAKPHNYPAALNSLRASIVCSLILSPVAAILPQILVADALSTYRAFSMWWPIELNIPVLAFWWDNPNSPVGYVPSLTALVGGTLLGMLIHDFFYYWFHRLQHSTFLWEQHKLHHSDAHFSAMTSMRGHWLEMSLQVILVTLPIALIFNLTKMQTFLAGLIIQQHVIFIHANLRISYGPLTRLIYGPQTHRIHHSIKPEHHDKNFAVFFPIWDIVFGTYYHPKPGEFAETGVEGSPSLLAWKDLLFGPFIAWKNRLHPTNRPTSEDMT